jgi:hypothetical protein
VLAAMGGSFVKPLITGTVTLCSNEVSRTSGRLCSADDLEG